MSLYPGAYIVKETQRAAAGSYENPIQAGIEATHANYDRCATLMLETAAKSARSNAVSDTQRPWGVKAMVGMLCQPYFGRTATCAGSVRAFVCMISSSVTRDILVPA